MLKSKTRIVAPFVLLFLSVQANQGFGTGKQDWGYVDIREGAHMFYWLYYTTATPNFTERPLVIWLQGGPGVSSTGLGNFLAIGPQDKYGNERNDTWVKDVNVLFIDNPVGVGFSYVDDEKILTTNNQQIAKDLVTFMKAFYKKHVEFEQIPLHIFGESYGGKMAPQFALDLYYTIQRKELRSNLTSVVLVSPAVSMEDTVMTYAPVLLNLGIVDNNGYNKVLESAKKTKELVESEEWYKASWQWGDTLSAVRREAICLDIYNILTPQVLGTCERGPLEDKTLKALMQGPVSKFLSIPHSVQWTFLNFSVYESLRSDIFMPAIDVVSELLDKTNIQVGVVSGQLDLPVSTAGTVSWINKMEWSYKNEYLAAPRKAININGVLEGHEKTAGKFSMFWVYRSGHMVPADNPKAMKYILRKFTNYG